VRRRRLRPPWLHLPDGVRPSDPTGDARLTLLQRSHGADLDWASPDKHRVGEEQPHGDGRPGVRRFARAPRIWTSTRPWLSTFGRTRCRCRRLAWSTKGVSCSRCGYRGVEARRNSSPDSQPGEQSARVWAFRTAESPSDQSVGMSRVSVSRVFRKAARRSASEPSTLAGSGSGQWSRRTLPGRWAYFVGA